ncbi:MAG: Druantia anti-phage system protein DruA, partial [Chloroflexota bacterium]
GCLLFCGAAKSLGARDRWIGWTEAHRLQRLAWVVNLGRHLVFPWVQVRNLSSHVLARVAARLQADWERRWNYRPVLLETFVDPGQHEGSCYKAAGWQEVGMSSGEGLVRPGQRYTTTPKKIFLKPLCADWRSLLCSELPPPRGLQ